MESLSAITKRMRVFLILFILFSAGGVVCSDNFDEIIIKEINTDDKIPVDPVEPHKWSKYENIATPRASAAIALYGSYVYVYGGESYFSSRGDLWKFNPIAETKEILTSHDVKSSHAMCVYGNLLVTFGGKNETGAPTQTFSYYSISGDTWGSIAVPSGTTGPAPAARYGHVMSSYNGLIYIHGGSDASGNVDGIMHSLDPLDSPKPRWENLAEGPELEGHGAALYNGKIYIFGGYNTTSSSYSNNLWIYDIASDAWQNAGQVAGVSPRGGIDLVEVNGFLYTLCGQDDSSLYNDLVRISTSGSGTVIETEIPKRSYASLVASANRLGLFGGYDRDNITYYSDVWICYPDNL